MFDNKIKAVLLMLWKLRYHNTIYVKPKDVYQLNEYFPSSDIKVESKNRMIRKTLNCLHKMELVDKHSFNKRNCVYLLNPKGLKVCEALYQIIN